MVRDSVALLECTSIIEDRCGGSWRRGSPRGREVLDDCLTEGVVAGEDTELCRQCEPAEMLRMNARTYASRLVHVNPDTVDIDTGIGAIEQRELIVPVAGSSL